MLNYESNDMRLTKIRILSNSSNFNIFLNFIFQVKGLDICLFAKDYKIKPNFKDTLFAKEEHYSTLMEIIKELGINTTKNPRQLNLANKITDFVENTCPANCLFEISSEWASNENKSK